MRNIFLFILCLLWINSPALAEQNQTLESIEKLFKQFLNAELAKTQKEFSYQIAPLDSRLRLPACRQQPEAFTPRGALKAGRNTIALRCNAGKRWTIYSSVTIKLYQPVLVLTRAIGRGEILSERHIKYQKMDLGLLRQGYLDNPASILNKQAKRNLASGAILLPQLFELPDLVKRGETVKIQAVNPHFQISMSGVALMNGKKGQNIRVRNIHSKRIVQARVTQPGLVTIF